jgi:quercetin dioxygenase-like cupin family protein
MDESELKQGGFMLDFDSIDEVTIPHMKGGKGYAKARMKDDGQVKIMRSILDPGCSIGYHSHLDSSEICYILEGEADCVVDGKEETVKAGQVSYCPKGSSHSMENKTSKPLVVLCVVPKQ